MPATGWRVGQLARATGLTVRTLHHYDQLGLVTPSTRSGAGHRLYTGADVTRLYQVIALRQLGLGLRDIGAVLAHQQDPRPVLRDQLEQVRAALANAQRLHGRLVDVLAALDRHESPTAMEFLTLIEETRMTDQSMSSYYTPEQQAALTARYEQLGGDGVRAIEAEWPQLIARAQAEMDAGTDPADPKVQAIAQRWDELVAAFTGNDPGIGESLNRVWEERGDQIRQAHGGPSPEVSAYVHRGRQAGG